MSKAASGWQKVLNRVVKDKQIRKLSGWLCCLVFVALLWVLNWKLFLATFAGIGLMSLCYLLQNPYWQRYCQQWQRFLVGFNRQLVFAVGSGATGAFCTYLAASVWANAENQWLATGFILQGLVSLTTLLVLLRFLGHKKENTAEAKLERLLEDLSHSNSLKRLVAVRQLTRLLISNRFASDLYSQSIEYFYLMLSEPQLPVVKSALLESLDLLDTEHLQQYQPTKIRTPIKLQRSRQPLVNLSFEDR